MTNVRPRAMQLNYIYKIPLMRTYFWITLFALLFTACGSDTAESTDNASDTEVMEEAAPSITMTAMPASPDFPDAAIKSMTYQDGTFTFDVDGGGTYELGGQTESSNREMCANSAKGQHIHLIVDDMPYAAKYESTFDHEVADGKHYMLAFLSRSYHESLKHPAAAKAVMAAVSNNSFMEVKSFEDPILFYSRPKGTYVGKDTENLMLDFYPVNVELGADYQVKVEVGGETFMADKWQPYILKGLPMGEHTVTLTLVDGQGNTVDAPLNPISRKITLAADPAE